MVSFDPFSTDMAGFALSGPLFLVIIVVAVLGVVIGGAAAWLGQVFFDVSETVSPA